MRRHVRMFCALALTALLLSGCGTDPAPEKPTEIPVPEGDYVRIQVDGVTKACVPLSEPQTVTLRQPTGEENVVEITSSGAVMRSANCHNQDCVHMGAVTIDNWETRPNGAFIICLPHRVTVELIVRE